jgi:thiamine pyrophosphokinase
MLAIIVADAPVADLSPYLALISRAHLLIGADGGARHLLAHGLTPHVVIGDLDSLEARLAERLEGRGVEIQRFPAAKNETDLELALLLALERGATQVRILAALGGRPDMHLANHLLLAHPQAAGRDIALLDHGWHIRLLRDRMTLRGQPGRRVSLLPLGDVTGVTTSGLRYPLRDEPLLLGPARGVSNEFAEPVATISIGGGTLVVLSEE